MKSVQDQEQKIWISQDIYIPVDSQGHCLGKYYEGAMGVIVEIIHLNGGSHALKIPWLMSDTSKENAYISELLTEERTSVMNIFSDGDNTAGLMQAEVFGISVLQKSIQTRDARPEVRTFHNAIVAIQFQRGKAPRFCAIHPDLDDRDKIELFPQTIQDCPLEDRDVFSKAYHKARSNETDWENVVAVNLDSKNDSPDVYCLKSSFDSRNYENIWYIGVPATIYVWGSSTLHEAITEGKLANWNLSDQLVLLERITNGVHSLHRRGYLHTDIRPANIMSRGDCRIPNNYFLIDYAGYNIGLSSNKDQTDIQGKTSEPVFLGPSIGGERNSPFYAPERKKGVEKEGADIAIILDRKDHYLVLFGWRSILLKDTVPEIEDEILSELNHFEFNKKTSINHGNHQNIKEDDLLLPGDRLQIREYIFDIEAVGTLNDALKGEEVYKCSKKYWRIFHGKIVINCDKPLEQSWMAIPRIIELRQWAVGTDCYGIGALFLYCLYRMPGDLAVKSKVGAEIAFQRLLEELSNPHYLNIIWYELSCLCTQLSICHRNLKSTDDLKRIIFKPEKYRNQTTVDQEEDGKTIDEYARHLASLIVHTSPDTAIILKNINYNYVHFLYSIYFSLCCLHRQQTMDKNLMGNEDWSSADDDIRDKLFLPFCQSRTTQPGSKKGDLPIEIALTFIGKFKRIVDSDYFKDFVMSAEGLKKPENVPAPVLRREIVTLENQVSTTQQEINKLNRDNVDLVTIKHELENQLMDLGQRLNSIQMFAKSMKKRLFYSSSQTKKLITEIKDTKTNYKN